MRADYPKRNTNRNSDEYEAQIANAYDKAAPLRRKEKTGVDFFDEIIELIKGFIREVRRALKDANVLTPEVRNYLDSLLSDPENNPEYNEDASPKEYALTAPEWNNYFKGEGGLFAGAESADNMWVENQVTLKIIKNLADVLSTGESFNIESKTLNEKIEIEAGYLHGERKNPKGKPVKGEGLKHIIQSRMENDRLNIDDTTSLIIAVINSVITGNDISTQKDIDSGYKLLEKNGIKALLSKKRGNDLTTTWLLTGFRDNKNEGKATETIQTGNAQYGNTPEYSLLRKQVGAVASSLNSLSTQSAEKSSGRATATFHATRLFRPRHHPLRT